MKNQWKIDEKHCINYEKPMKIDEKLIASALKNQCKLMINIAKTMKK